MASKATVLTVMMLLTGIAAPQVLLAECEFSIALLDTVECVLSIVPPDTAVILGDDDPFVLHVCVDSGAVDLMGYNITVQFDESLLEVLEVEEGALPANSGHETFFYWLNEGSGDNFVLINGAILGKTVNGPGVLFDITFMALAEGLSDIEIISSDLRNNLNAQIAHSDSSGSVCIIIPVGTEESSWGLIKMIFR